MSKGKSFPITLVAFGLLAGLGLAGIATYVQSAPGSKQNPILKEQAPVQRPTNEPTDPVDPAPLKEQVSVQSIKQTETGYELSGSVKVSAKEPELGALNAMLETLGYKEFNFVDFQVSEDGLATLDVSSGIRSGFSSGEESDFVKALQVCLGQFPKVKSVVLKVDGEKLDTLGHLELSEPILVGAAANASEPAPDAGQ